MFMYCKHCGLKNIKTKEHSCPACEIELEAVPQKYLTGSGLMFASQATKKEFEEYKTTRPQKTCPICQSTSLSKISNVGKGVKVAAFGILGAGDMGKTWKCNSCGCKF